MKAKDTSHSSMFINRRGFLNRIAATGAGLCVAPGLFAGEWHNSSVWAKDPSPKQTPLVDSLPALQCPTETSIVVVWAVGKPASGFVEFGTQQDHLDQTACGEIFGLKPYHERFLQIRIRNLKPNTKYYYRTVTRSFQFVSAYKFESGDPVYSDVFSFETSGPGKTRGSFSVINDTHNDQGTLKRLAERLALVNSDYTVWNGDVVNSFDDADMAVKAVLQPGNTSFAVEKPLLFVPGNHDFRGVWARNASLVFPEWEHPNLEDRVCGRNFVVRTGPLALIGLDTGEDKPDNHPAWAGMARFEPYRVAQRDWLDRVLQSPEVADAPFVVAFCHIPLYSSDSNANGGDLQTGYASFQRQAANLWGPLLSKHGVQCLIAAHNHHFDYVPASPERSWAQILGGGHGMQSDVTVIHGTTNNKFLEVIVDELNTGRELGRWKFDRRVVNRGL